MERLQYQALKKATGAVQGSSIEKVDKIAGVEDVDIIMKSAQTRFVARSIANSTGVGDICLGCETEVGRHWRDKELRWAPKEHVGKDGYTSIASRMLAQLDLQEDEKLS